MHDPPLGIAVALAVLYLLNDTGTVRLSTGGTSEGAISGYTGASKSAIAGIAGAAGYGARPLTHIKERI